MGWDRNEYPKAAHELRKLMGSRWYTELGAEVAQEWLGHESVATTCSFYTALRRQPRALTRENAKA
jgi:integrase